MATTNIGAFPLDQLGVDASMLDSKKKRALARLVDSLKRKSPLIDTGALKVANWGEILGDVVRNYQANNDLDAIENDERNLATQLQQRRAQGMAEIATAESPNIISPQGPEPSGEAMSPVSAPKSREEVLQKLIPLLANPDSAVSGQANKRMEEIRKAMTDEKLAILRNAQHLGARTLQEANVEGRPNVSFSANGDLANIVQPNGQIQQQPMTQYGPMRPATSGMPAGQIDTRTNRFLPAGSGQLASPEGQAAMEMAKGGIDDLRKRLTTGYDKISNAVGEMQYFEDAKKLLKSSIAGSPFPEAESTLRKAANYFGFSPDNNGKLPATEIVASTLAPRALQILQALRPASDPDRVYAEKMAGSGAITDPRAAEWLITAAQAALLNEVKSHDKNKRDLQAWSSDPKWAGVIGPLLQQYELPNFNFEATGIQGGGDTMFRAGSALDAIAPTDTKTPSVIRYDKNGKRIQ